MEARGDKRPQLSDLRDSGSIEQAADLVLFIYRYHVYNPLTALSSAELIVDTKQRSGPQGRVNVHWDGPAVRFLPTGTRAGAVPPPANIGGPRWGRRDAEPF